MENKSPLSGIRNGKKLIRRYFLVDYENVQAHGLRGLSKLKDTDAVTVYFSKNADTITFEMHIELNECKARTDFKKVETGVKNALDFQLSSQLGYIINQNIVAGNKGVKYYIVSMDGGFSVLVNFWKQFGAEVEVVRSIEHAVDPSEPGAFSAVLAELSADENEERIILECLNSCVSTTELHNALQNRLRNNARSSEIYRAVKPLFNGRQESGEAKRKTRVSD